MARYTAGLAGVRSADPETLPCAGPSNEAFDQRLAVRSHLDPFDLQETIGCIRHHVKGAG